LEVEVSNLGTTPYGSRRIGQFGAGGGQVRAGDQPQDRQGAGPDSAKYASRTGRRGDRVARICASRLLHLLTTASGTKRRITS
jgi:hypothetical protein